MNRLWDAVIKPCLELSGSKNIVEIGSDSGVGTKNLIRFCKGKGGTLTSIDPFPGFDYKEWEKQEDGAFKLYTDLSLNRLPLLKDYDAILIDGDHNWYTVYNELLIIKKVFGEDNLPLILIHDMMWPYAKRDLYYNPDNIPDAYRHPYAKKGILQNDYNLAEKGGLNSHLYNAIYENNPKNGVRTAVEDFLEETNNKYLKLQIVSAFYGVGVITDTRRQKDIQEYLTNVETLGEINKLLESNRGELMIGVSNLRKEKQSLSEQKEELEERTQQLVEQKEKLEERTQQLVEQKEKLEERTQQLVEQKEELEERNRKLDNQVIIREEEKFKKQLEIDKLRETINQLEVTIANKNKIINRLQKEISIHLNSIKYRIGDAIVKASHPSIDTLKMPIRIARLFKEGLKKKDNHVEQKNNENNNIQSLVNVKSVSNIVTKQNKSKQELNIKRFNYSNFEEQLNKLMQEKVNIIIPIYNAVDEVRECIKSVITNTTFPHRIILIDDCSPDPEIRELLNKYEDRDGIEVIYNEENMGYVKTINKAIQGTIQGDVVLLNSDTKVSKKWLTKMVISAMQDKKVGTVTPFSNAAGAFSVPIIGENKEIPDYLTLNDMNCIVEKNSNFTYVEVPTGNGFCLYVKRNLIDDIGLFDDVTFSRGYGEENDFCMRALNKGWKNIIDDSTYIYHKRSASFSDSKEQLIKENREKLDKLHPDYKDKIKMFRQDDNLIKIREKIEKSMSEFSTNYKLYNLNKNILYVLHEGAGGTPNTNKDLMNIVNQNNYTTYILTSNGQVLKLGIYKEKQIHEIMQWKISGEWDINVFESEEYRDIYFDILYNLKIDVLHVRHLFKHTFDIVNIANVLNIPVVMSFHDFYYICPSIHMLDNKGKYCEGNCCRDKQNCFIPSSMIKIHDNIPNWVQDVWKPKVSELFSKCDAFVTTSEYSKELHIKAYSMLAEEKFYSIEHGRDFDYSALNPIEFYSLEKIKILLPGNIDFHKGSKFIAELIDYDKDNKFEFHVIGKIDQYLEGKVINHGPYQRDEFIDKVKKIKPNFIGVISIWPETYCHTLTEAWSCGIPTIVSDIGTLRERALGGGAVLIDDTNIEETYNKIIEAYQIETYKILCKQVLEVPIRSVNNMAVEYIKLYKMLQSKQPLNMIYVFVNENQGKFPPSANIRVMAPIVNNHLINENSYISINPNIDNISFDMDVEANVYMLIQRDCLSENNLEKIIRLKKIYAQIKIVFEIDDDILSINNLHPEYAKYITKIELLKKLYQVADSVITTNDKILEKYEEIYGHKDSFIIPNYIDERMWLSPIDKRIESKANNDIVKICYVGSITHTNDLMFLEKIMNRLKQECKEKFQLYLVGGTKEQKSWYKTIKIPNNRTNYPDFVKWLRSINDFHIALAPLNLENELNHSKSYLKYLEYGVMDIAGIYTEIKPFKEVIHQKENGILINGNKYDEWGQSLRECIENPELRKQMSMNAKKDIIDNHLLKDNLYRWKEVFTNNENSI